MAYRKFIATALRGEPIDLYGTGEQTRSNTYIDDCVDVTIAALDKGGIGEIYNISGSEKRSINEALAIMESQLGVPIDVNRHPEARGDQAHTMGNSDKAREELGFLNSVTLEEGLAKQITWQRVEGRV
jgi:nucleoside-diphosphate-sugar epimerase